MKRLVQPEILDSLPQDHPDAKANRRDLRLINRVMGNYAWFAKRLVPLLHRDDQILELGAGTGELGLSLQKQIEASFSGLDVWSRPPDWPPGWDWIQDDLVSFEGYANFDVLVANLILHQFEEDALRILGEKIAASKIDLILASEPARYKVHQWQLKLLRPLGLNHVSRHDGHVSIEAGFRGGELPALLGLDEARWEIEIASGIRGAYRMVARRRGGSRP